jgi:Ca2+-binding RTX toxin-like protein
MLQVHDSKTFHDDGRVRRKHEFDDEQGSRLGFKAAVGFVIASTIIFAKNMLFAGYNKPSHDNPAPADNDAKARPEDGAEVLHAEKGEETPPSSMDDQEAAKPLGREKHYASAMAPIELSPYEEFRSKLKLTPALANDNAPLYGAPAGQGVALPVLELALPRVQSAGDGGGSSGGSNTPSTGPGGTGNLDDDPVKAANRRPYTTGFQSLGKLLVNNAIVIGLIDLLKNVVDPDGDRLFVTDLTSSSGALSAGPDGTWTFVPDFGDTSFVTFNYRVSDGEYSVGQTAYLDLILPPSGIIEGTEGNDYLIGTPFDDVIMAYGGDDTVIGREGADVIYGGDGDDRIIAGDGDDVVFAGNGNDFVLGGAGNDTLFGEAGDDMLFGEDGDDILVGGSGNDYLNGGAGADVLYGDSGDDVLDAGDGNDQVFGGDGNDVIYASRGHDYVDGGTGTNTYDTTKLGSATFVDLSAGTAETSDGASTAEFYNIHNVTTGDGNDVVIGDGRVNIIATGDGHDVIDDQGGNDRVDAGRGDDTIIASLGNDHIDGGDGVDTYDASRSSASIEVRLDTGTTSGDDVGNDRVMRIEIVMTGAGNDVVIGDNADNVLMTGRGDDVIYGLGGNDVVDAGEGNDAIMMRDGDGADRYDGGEGFDTIDASELASAILVDLTLGLIEAGGVEDRISNIEAVIGTSFGDTFIADDAMNVFYGGLGDDLFVFLSTASCGRGSGSRDRILDFAVGDQLDLDGIAREFAESLGGGPAAMPEDPRFTLISGSAKFSKPGELRLKYDDFEDGTRTLVLDGNTDFDENSEFQIEFGGDANAIETILVSMFGRTDSVV